MARRLAITAGSARTVEETKEVLKKIQIADELGVEAVFTGETWGGTSSRSSPRSPSSPRTSRSARASPPSSAARPPSSR